MRTLPAMEYTLKRSKKCALAGLQCTKAAGANPMYYVLGQTAAGRYLFCVVIQFPNGKGFSVTAPSLSAAQKRR